MDNLFLNKLCIFIYALSACQGLKHSKQQSKVFEPKQEEKAAPKFEEKSVKTQTIEQPPPFVKETKPLFTEADKKGINRT